MFDLDIDALKTTLTEIDPQKLIPEIQDVVSIAVIACRIVVMAIPLILLGLGIAYLLFAPKEANYYFGYRTAFGMGSVSAWRRTQKVAGVTFSLLGMVLSVGMLLYTSGMSRMEPMDMAWMTIGCLILEGIVVLASRFLINSIAMSTFNFRGERRRKKNPVSAKN